MMLVDVKKAFHTIHHEILLGKIHAICFSEKAIAWFKWYLSDLSKIFCGVHQRSILGPLLFLLHVNDMAQAIHSDLFSYADDSGVTFQHKNFHTSIK